MKDHVSRRSFLKTSLAGGATLAAASLLSACSGAGSAASTAGSAASKTGLYIPGTYSSKATGMGEVIVTMTFDDNSITDVVLDLSNETPSIGQAAADQLKEALMTAQSAEIDGVSGATITSQAVTKAADKCIQQAKGEIPVEVVTKTEETDDGDWLGTEPEIADSDITATYDTEVLVIGCGTGGMFAVCAAAEEGAKVIGIDRFPTGVGIRDDLGAINSRYQQEWGTKIDKFDYVTMATQYAAGHINQDLVKLFCDESGAVIDWYGDRLAERGVELWHESGDSVDESRYHHFATGHSPRWTGSDDGSGNELGGNKVLYD